MGTLASISPAVNPAPFPPDTTADIDWFGVLDPPADLGPDPDPEPTDMAQELDRWAGYFRSQDTNFGRWLGDQLASLAQEARFFDAVDPATLEDRRDAEADFQAARTDFDTWWATERDKRTPLRPPCSRPAQSQPSRAATPRG
jgi:hypothetical protein